MEIRVLKYFLTVFELLWALTGCFVLSYTLLGLGAEGGRNFRSFNLGKFINKKWRRKRWKEKN